MRLFKIFLASPGDVIKERNLIEDLVKEVNQITSLCFNVEFVLHRWENAYSNMGRPQQVINDQLDPENCDLFIGILWSRFGSPTGFNENIESGTEEEFQIAYKHWKLVKSPQIMFYRCVKKISAKTDSEQIQKVNAFFNEFKHDSTHPGLYVEYQNIKQLEQNIRKSLIIYALNHSENSGQKNELSYKNSFENGIQTFYTYLSNDIRMQEKSIQLGKTNLISLVAQSGYSFIATYGNRYRKIIVDQLKAGKTFKLVITNPWSYSGLLLALSEKDISEVHNLYEKTKNGIMIFKAGVELIKNSQWYSIKFKGSINGYLTLKREFGDHIQLRITKYEIPSSVLITDNYCFLEPYLPVNQFERQNFGLLTFETMIDKTSRIYKHATSYFDFMWNSSEEYDSFIANENIFIDNFSKMEELYE